MIWQTFLSGFLKTIVIKTCQTFNMLLDLFSNDNLEIPYIHHYKSFIQLHIFNITDNLLDDEEGGGGGGL